MQPDAVTEIPVPVAPSTMQDWPGGWTILKRSIIDFFTNIVPFLVALLAGVPLVLALILNSSAHSTSAVNGPTIILVAIGVLAVIYTAICLSAAMPLYGLARADGRKMSVRDVFQFRFILFLKLLAAQLILVVPIIIGFILLVIPGLVALFLLAPTMAIVPYIIAEQNTGPIEGIKLAYSMVKPYRGKVYGLYGWFILLSLLLVIPIVVLVAVIISMNHTGDTTAVTHKSGGNNSFSGNSGGAGPITSIAFAYLYRYIQGVTPSVTEVTTQA